MEGILLLNKTKNRTSRDMVNELNHIFDMKKIGHTGTLDPIATGVLVMCMGKYTKMVDILQSFQKEYIATIKLGISTDTLDITGNILETRDIPKISLDDILKVFKSLLGKQRLIIPKYSAKKINGKKLYEYARENKEIILPENEIEIFKMELLDYDEEYITFKTIVSKGTYIRSLIQIVCDKLKTIGTMASLERTRQGKFSINDSYTIDDIKEGNYIILHAKDVLDYPVFEISDEEYNKVKNGNKIELKCDEDFVILTKNGQEIAIYQKKGDLYHLKIMLI